MAKIIFQGNGFGDFLCCFKALYAIKNLYPSYELIIYHSGIDERFLKQVGFSVDFPYKKVIGINAFSNHIEFLGINFYHKDWYYLATSLARAYPQFLFILLNFKHNPLQYNDLSNLPNLKIFVNNDSIASLVSVSLSLDYLISIDTGNVHLCNILQIPALVFTDKRAQYRFIWGGGITNL